MTDNPSSKPLIVIGAGPGGYAAAFMATDLGLQVTLIDPEPNPGGVCLYRGCIPSKSLLHISKLIHEAKASSQWGVDFGEPRIDLKRVLAWKDSVIQKLTGGLGILTKQRKIEYVQGIARFVSSHQLEVKRHGGGTETFSFEHAILATGTEAVSLPILHKKSSRIWDSSDALKLNKIPKTMLVIGGGYIGLELGSVYAAFGTKVTVVEMLPGVMPGTDRDLVSVFLKRAKQIFESILTETVVAKVKDEKNGYLVQFDGKDLETKEARFDTILVSVGRKPNTQHLDLESTQVKLDDKGFVQVDLQRHTSDEAIYAIGDVAGGPLLAHKASYEGRIVAEVIAGEKVAYEPAAIPGVVYTDPEIAFCGLTETQAKVENRNIRVVKFPWAASGRALAMGLQDGLTKLIIDPESERVLGIGIAGSGAGELISEGVLAIEMAALASDLEWTIHPHPTLSETIMEAAGLFYGRSIHLYRSQKRLSLK